MNDDFAGTGESLSTVKITGLNFFSLTGNLAIIFNIPQSHDGTKVLQLLQFWTVQEGNRVSRDDKAWIRHCYTFMKIDASVRQKLIARRGFNPLYRESNTLMFTSWRFIYEIIIFFSFISFSDIVGDFLVINTSVFCFPFIDIVFYFFSILLVRKGFTFWCVFPFESSLILLACFITSFYFFLPMPVIYLCLIIVILILDLKMRCLCSSSPFSHYFFLFSQPPQAIPHFRFFASYSNPLPLLNPILLCPFPLFLFYFHFHDVLFPIIWILL